MFKTLVIVALVAVFAVASSQVVYSGWAGAPAWGGYAAAPVYSGWNGVGVYGANYAWSGVPAYGGAVVYKK